MNLLEESRVLGLCLFLLVTQILAHIFYFRNPDLLRLCCFQPVEAVEEQRRGDRLGTGQVARAHGRLVEGSQLVMSAAQDVILALDKSHRPRSDLVNVAAEEESMRIGRV